MALSNFRASFVSSLIPVHDLLLFNFLSFGGWRSGGKLEREGWGTEWVSETAKESERQWEKVKESEIVGDSKRK